MAQGFDFIGPVTGGKFLPDSRNALRFAVQAFEGKTMRMRIEEYRPTRSNQQNRAWFGIVIKAFMIDMGERDKDYVHRQVLLAIGHYEMKPALDGTLSKEPKPTHNMDTDAFSKLYEAAQELGAKMGIMIPDPDSLQAAAAVGSR